MKRQNLLCSILLFGFLLGIYEGKIALWKDNQTKPMRIFPYSASMLPKEDQKRLEQGVEIDSLQQLRQLVKEYLS